MTRSTPLLAALLLAAACTASIQRSEPEGETLVFLVRHAERAEDGTDDPHLSEEGKARAELLARLLQDVGITRIHSTDRWRTRETTAPLAARTGLEVELYDAGEPEAFAARLRATPGRHLVVGHSNSVPALVRALGGDPGPEIQSLEYDRLYLVVLRGGEGEVVLLRFGAAFEG